MAIPLLPNMFILGSSFGDLVSIGLNRGLSLEISMRSFYLLNPVVEVLDLSFVRGPFGKLSMISIYLKSNLLGPISLGIIDGQILPLLGSNWIGVSVIQQSCMLNLLCDLYHSSGVIRSLRSTSPTQCPDFFCSLL